MGDKWGTHGGQMGEIEGNQGRSGTRKTTEKGKRKSDRVEQKNTNHNDGYFSTPDGPDFPISKTLTYAESIAEFTTLGSKNVAKTS